MPEFTTLKTRTEDAVLFAEIDSPPINLIGTALVTDPDFFIPHVDVTKIAEYREAAAKLSGEASIGALFRRLSETKAITIARIAGRVRRGGNEFVLACDLRFASRERAIFGQMEAGFGLSPRWPIGQLIRLPDPIECRER
jgi:enoyl-CoA hydratase/carnithine racemase